MAITLDPRTGLPHYSLDTDAAPDRDAFNVIMADLIASSSNIGQGTLAARVAATDAAAPSAYWATDVNRLFIDTGTTWVEVGPIGGGGLPPALTFTNAAQAGTEGSSRIGMRKDARPAIPAWPVQNWRAQRPTTPAFFDLTAGGGMSLILHPGPIAQASAPQGLYQVDVCLMLRTSSTAVDALSSSHLRVVAGLDGFEGNMTGDFPIDVDNHLRPYCWSDQMIWPSTGNFDVEVYLDANGAAVRMFGVGTHVNVTYLGPA